MKPHSKYQEGIAALSGGLYRQQAGFIIIILLFIAESLWFPSLTALPYILTVLSIAIIGINLAYARRGLLAPINTLLQDTQRELDIATIKTASFYDSMPDAIISISAEDNTITLFSKGAENMFGYREDEVLGKNVNILMPDPYRTEHDTYVKNYVDTGVKKIIGRIRVVKALRKSGEVFDIDLSVSESILPTGRAFNAIIRDITAKVRAESALEEKNRELEKRNSYERSYGEIMSLFGSSYNEKEVLQGTLSRLANIHPFPVSAIYLYDEWAGKFNCIAAHGAPASLKAEIAQGEGLIGQAALDKKRFILNEGIDRAIQLNIDTGIVSLKPSGIAICPIMHQQKVTGVLVIGATEPLTELDGIFFDRLSDQLGIAINGIRQFSNLKLLSEELKIKSDEIAAKNSQLEHASKMKSEFLANMSHELRTPLNAIIGFSEVLKDGLLGELNQQQKSYITDVFTSGQHLLSLINDILDLSKVEAGKMSLEIEKAYIPDIIDNSITIIKEKAFANNIKLSSHIDSGIEFVYIDARKFRQILYNLLSNAVKFTPGGGTVDLHVQRVQFRNRDILQVTVTDSGIGIAQEDLHKLFKPFEQLDGSVSRKYEGTGLGLAMVKQLVELHNGNVEVESTLGKGSKFIVTMPYNEAIESERQPKHTAIARPARPSAVDAPLILIVEDDDKSAELICVQLESEGYNTLRATTAQEGLDLAASRHPDLITLDIMLPDTSGWELLAQLKSQETLAAIPVIIVSIVANEQKSFSLDVFKTVQKPVEKEILVTAVHEALISVAGYKSVLIIDDDPRSVDMISQYLEDIGADTLKTYNGRDGIDVAVRKAPDLILLDLLMPEMSGFEVVNALREIPETKEIPIIILTAKTITAEDRVALSRATSILEKSTFNKSSLISNIKHLLDGKTKNKSAEKHAPRKTPDDSKPAYPKDIPLVLIVEDNQKESDILSLFLKNAGYSVMQASNGVEALSLMRENMPTLILLDLMMPIMDGFTFLDEKSRDPVFTTIPVIVSSHLDGDNINCVSLESTMFLKKPIRRNELSYLISTLGIEIQSEIKPKILIIDDDPKSVKIITTYLNTANYEVLCAYGGMEGIEQARQNNPQLIVLDLMMPEINGFDVLENLKNDEITKSIPVIVLTAKTLTQEEQGELIKNVKAVYEKSTLNKNTFLNKVVSSIDRKLFRGEK